MIPEPKTLAVYVHWPFCRAKCPYCDFNSHVAAGVDQGRWRRALLAEIDATAALVPGRKVTSIFFGGGTPSLMPPATAAAVIARIGERWRLEDDIEITLEANPTSVEAGRLADFAAAGVNRVSLGVQALDDAALAFLGREHGVGEALDAVATARRAVGRVSFDLIYGRPGQDAAAWRGELERAVAHADGHLSAYQLTIEKGTAFYAAHRDGAFALPDEATAAALYETTQETLAAAGLPAYEVSNHARPGEACRHNLATWRYDDYAGIGPGAHGRLTVTGRVHASEAIPAPEGWLAAVEAHGHARRRLEVLAAATVAAEMLMMGLRLAEGVSAERITARTGHPLDAWLDAAAAKRLGDAGMVARDAAGLRVTAAGMPLLDSILARLIAG